MNLLSYLRRGTTDGTANVLLKDIIGSKVDAAAPVGTTKSLVAYAKQGIMQSWRCVEKSDGSVPNNTTDDLFTITGGPIRCKIVGLVTTIIGGAANARLRHTTVAPAATVELNAALVAIDADAVGTIYQNVGATSVFTPSTGLGYKIVDPVTVEETEFILDIGTIKFFASATQTGNIKWYLSYQPLTPSAVVVAAA